MTVPTTEFTAASATTRTTPSTTTASAATVTGTNPGDKVEVWFDGGGKRRRASPTRGPRAPTPVLLLSDEDWSGVQPAAPAAGPPYLDTYKALLDAQGVAYDVYDVPRPQSRPTSSAC